MNKLINYIRLKFGINEERFQKVLEKNLSPCSVAHRTLIPNHKIKKSGYI